MKKTILTIVVLITFAIALFSFGKKQNYYQVASFDSQYEVTLWLNETQPGEIISITTTGTWWNVFYIK